MSQIIPAQAISKPVSQDQSFGQIEQVLINGNLAVLSPEQRKTYYMRVCETLGLNPLTRPFDYITLNGKLVLYARKDCTDQLRCVRKVSIRVTAREVISGVYVVTSQAKLPDGREDESTGAVTIEGLSGEYLANAMMKAETKSKRRATLSICGLGMLDESEKDDIPPESSGLGIRPEEPGPEDNLQVKDPMEMGQIPYGTFARRYPREIELEKLRAYVLGTCDKSITKYKKLAETRPLTDEEKEKLRRVTVTADFISDYLARIEMGTEEAEEFEE